jgi:predicted ABC-type ATPase
MTSAIVGLWLKDDMITKMYRRKAGNLSMALRVWVYKNSESEFSIRVRELSVRFWGDNEGLREAWELLVRQTEDIGGK